MNNPALYGQQNMQQVWRAEYHNHLDRRLDLTLSFFTTAPIAQIRQHLHSFLSLLAEACRYSGLTAKTLELISRLHPLPLRWGLGHVWEAELRFALDHTSVQNPQLIDEYRCSLGDVYLFRGQFERVIAVVEPVVFRPNASDEQIVRALRLLFTCYRANGQPGKADDLIGHFGERFLANAHGQEVPVERAQAWLRLQQCRLEQLRERGKVDQALELVEEMIWLDEKMDFPDRSRSAELLTHRSTLRWVRSRYQEAVDDLHKATDLYRQDEDHFNAEALKSNLGLVYWTMGELTLAEQTLLSAIRFYRETGSEQLLTYDIANLGLVYFARGQLAEALRLTEEHIALANKIGFIHEYNRGRRNLGTILFYFGEYERSIEETSASHAYYETRGSRDAYGLDQLWLALCYFQLGQKEKALALANETLVHANNLGSRVLEQLTLRCLAHFLPGEQQLDLLIRSLELARSMERKVEEAAVHFALAGLFTDGRREEHWQAGAQILQAIGAEQWLNGNSMKEPPFLPLLL